VDLKVRVGVGFKLLHSLQEDIMGPLEMVIGRMLIFMMELIGQQQEVWPQQGLMEVCVEQLALVYGLVGNQFLFTLFVKNLMAQHGPYKMS
jgi:hypothetical protein